MYDRFRHFAEMTLPLKILTVLSFILILTGVVFLTLGTFDILPDAERFFIPCFCIDLILEGIVYFLRHQKIAGLATAGVGVLLLIVTIRKAMQ